MPASGVNSLRTFHTGKVVALSCLRPLSTEVMEASGGVLVTGGKPWPCFFVCLFCFVRAFVGGFVRDFVSGGPGYDWSQLSL